MGCYKSKCKYCGKIIKGISHLDLMIAEEDHERQRHLQVYVHNKAVRERFAKDYKKINDLKIKNETILFSKNKWDGEDCV